MSTTTYLETKHTLFHRQIYVEERPDALLTAFPNKQPLVQESRETKQSALLLNGAREPYTLVTDYSVPSLLHQEEILVKVTETPGTNKDTR